MAQTTQTLPDIDALVALAHRKGTTDRRALALQINGAFGSMEENLSDRERTLMQGILEQLLTSMERSVRRELAEQLGTDATVPPPLVRLLANDEIEIAGPILRGSRALRDPDLIQVITERSKQHQLAICARENISNAVSDAIVATGNPDVITALLHNKSAKIRHATLAYLTDQARSVDQFREPLVHRDDLPGDLAEKLYWLVTAALRSYIVERFNIDSSRLDDGIERIVKQAAAEVRANQANPTLSESLANELVQSKNFNPEFMVDALKSGEVPLFEAMLKQQTGLRTRLVRQLLFDDDGHGEGLAIMCRAIGMPREAFVDILHMVRRERQRTGSEAVASDRAALLFDRLEQAGAVAVLRRWRRDPQYVEAQIELLAETREAVCNVAA